jgi:hypothetical protein
MRQELVKLAMGILWALGAIIYEISKKLSHIDMYPFTHTGFWGCLDHHACEGNSGNMEGGIIGG